MVISFKANKTLCPCVENNETDFSDAVGEAVDAGCALLAARNVTGPDCTLVRPSPSASKMALAICVKFFRC